MAAMFKQAGVVFRWMQKENHPGCVRCGGFAKFFLMTQPPLLCFRLRAVALALRGGDARRGMALLRSDRIFFTASPSAPLRRLRDIFLVAQPPLLWAHSGRGGV